MDLIGTMGDGSVMARGVMGWTSVVAPDRPEVVSGEEVSIGFGRGGGVEKVLAGCVMMGEGVDPSTGDIVVTAMPMFSGEGVRERLYGAGAIFPGVLMGTFGLSRKLASVPLFGNGSSFTSTWPSGLTLCKLGARL